MTLYFPDLNVWLALSDIGHAQGSAAWNWLKTLPGDRRLIFSRFTQIGLLRLLSNPAVMGDQTLTLGKAWSVYERWLEETYIDFYPEPRNVEAAFRQATASFVNQQASKRVGDCWLLAFAKEAGATLVTFDRGLHAFARKQGHHVVVPG
ncbi:MAG TPA: TA system VapC family ribonuclease toxin [Terracidiphilus sp.]|nr:TA system VapC family ribonuclease toxin [Terracidiphilus sp.]